MTNTINTITESANGTSPVQPTSPAASATRVGHGTARRWTPTARKTVAERLRLLKAKWEEALEIEGTRAGRKWAEQPSNAVALQRLATSSDLWWGLNCHDYSDLPAGEQFFYAIRPEHDGNAEAALDFWKSITGARELPDHGFIYAFAEEAQWAWEQARD